MSADAGGSNGEAKAKGKETEAADKATSQFLCVIMGQLGVCIFLESLCHKRNVL